MMLFTALAFTSQAFATIDPACQDVADQGAPANYNEQAQADYLLNYFSLATTFSPLHAPVPAEPGRGAVGLELSAIPPISCARRLVLGYTKTEDTNKAPMVPRPRLLFAFPAIGKVVPYAGLGYVPPVTVFNTRNVILSAEVGAGIPFESGLQLGARYHATMMKTVAEIATPFEEGGETVLDFYSGSTFGVDLMGGWEAGPVTPYLAVGFTDVSTFFFIGDDAYVGNNLSPYAGLTTSLGAQAHFGPVDLGAEFYAAPMNFNTGALVEAEGESAATAAPAHIYTGRLRVAYAW